MRSPIDPMAVEHLSTVPHLTTALSGPLLALESVLLDKQGPIEAWLRRQWLSTPAPFYGSVDLRNAGFKLAPVDTNLFPAGFNNLNNDFMPLCVQAAQSAVERVCPKATGIALIPENHTRNVSYIESLATLAEILNHAGFDVRIGSLNPDITVPTEITSDRGRSITLHPITREADKISIGGLTPCLILLNNDLSAGRPPILEGLKQTLAPPLSLGWSDRLKSQHFAMYRKIAGEFATQIDIDPWLIDPLFRECGEINFMKREGEDCLARNVEALIDNIQKKYNEYGIDQPPFVIVKADAGTYGMGVMTVRSADEVLSLNRKQRTKMSYAKEGGAVTRTIMQEGVYTFETWGGNSSIAEPVIYMIDNSVVGGFYRVHTDRRTDENLNAPGMHFEPLAFAKSCIQPDKTRAPDAEPNRFYAYGVIARLALLAAAREIAFEEKP